MELFWSLSLHNPKDMNAVSGIFQPGINSDEKGRVGCD